MHPANSVSSTSTCRLLQNESGAPSPPRRRPSVVGSARPLPVRKNCPLTMELGICIRDESVSDAVRLGRFAEDLGFTYVFVPDVAGASPEGGSLSGRDAYVTL